MLEHVNGSTTVGWECSASRPTFLTDLRRFFLTLQQTYDGQCTQRGLQAQVLALKHPRARAAKISLWEQAEMARPFVLQGLLTAV
jgi:hypothetical protein